MARPWVDSPVLDCYRSEPLLSLKMDDIAAPVYHAQEMFRDLRNQLGETDLELAEIIDAGTEGRFRAEAIEWAKILGRTWQEILLANCAYDAAVRIFMCSSIAIETESGPVLARNMDWWPEFHLARGSVMLRHQVNGKPAFQIAGWIGGIGAVSGISANGFALAMNAVLSQDPVTLSGYPVMLFLRSVLEDAKSYEHALELICHTELASPCLVMLVGTENSERVVIERTPSRFAVRQGVPGDALVVTNDYRVMDVEGTAGVAGGHGLYSTACGRYDTLARLCESQIVDSGSDEAFLYVLSDSGVRMGITAQQMVFRPRENKARLVAPGHFFD